jgi:hypothetical protein
MRNAAAAARDVHPMQAWAGQAAALAQTKPAGELYCASGRTQKPCCRPAKLTNSAETDRRSSDQMMTTSTRWRLGEIEITRVLEFEAALFEPAVLYPEATAEIIERHRTWLEPSLMEPASGRLVFAFHSTIIKTPHATILVDTCSGNEKERPHKLRYHRKSWPYLANLAAAGFAPEDVDYVLCTHLHADHVGWNTRLLDGRWVPTFPKAHYLFARTEWEHWRVAELRARYTSDPYYEDSLLPVVSKLRPSPPRTACWPVNSCQRFTATST